MSGSSQYAFGSGVLFGKKTGVTTPTPVRFGALQECAIDISFSTKQLFGQYQYPLAIGRGTAKITGKAKFAQFNAQAFNDLFFGETGVVTGETITAVAESQVVPAGNVVTVTNNATFAQDLGVSNSTTGNPLQRVSASPVGTGNYSCNETTGNYTFNNALAAANAGSIVGVTSVPANSGVLCYVASAGTNPVVWVVSPPAASGGAALGWANYPYNGATSGGNLEWQTGADISAPGFDYSGGVGDGFTLIHFPADSITIVTASLFIDVTASVNARYAAQWLPSSGTPFAPIYELSIDTAVGAGQESFNLWPVRESP